MKLYRQVCGWLAAMAVFMSVVGCGGGDRVEVYPVSGTVMYEGKPMVGGGSIAFVPTTPRPGKTAGGEIRPDGTYQLSTYSPGDGSIPGEFRVVITQVVETEPDAMPDSDGSGSAQPTPSTNAVNPADRIPQVYSDHRNSPLTATVEATSANQLDFELKRQ
jgi:hypothetical protein